MKIFFHINILIFCVFIIGNVSAENGVAKLSFQELVAAPADKQDVVLKGFVAQQDGAYWNKYKKYVLRTVRKENTRRRRRRYRQRNIFKIVRVLPFTLGDELSGYIIVHRSFPVAKLPALNSYLIATFKSDGALIHFKRKKEPFTIENATVRHEGGKAELILDKQFNGASPFQTSFQISAEGVIGAESKIQNSKN